MSFDSRSIYNHVSYKTEDLIRRAKSGSFPPPADRQASTASGFGKWVYSLQHAKIISSKDYSETFKNAKKAENSIASLLNGLNGTSFDDGKKRFKPTGWETVYEDPLRENQATRNFEAPGLTVMGEPIRCKPDAVLFNRLSGELLIVERKTTTAATPDHCYPNIMAQLWCYAQIDFAKTGWLEKTGWSKPKGVLLAAELWSYKEMEDIFVNVDRQKYWLWRKGQREFNFVRQLFELYGGLITPKKQLDAP